MTNTPTTRTVAPGWEALLRPALLPDVLRERAAAEPDRTAYILLDESGAEADVLTYRELYRRARTVAGLLRSACVPGDRALLVFPQGLDFIVAYFGCLYARVLAVPVQPPRRDRMQEATRSIVRDCRPTAVLTVSRLVETLRPALDPLCETPNWLAVDGLPAADGGFDATPLDADSLAFLQYTSGSTSNPKGVMVSHGNLAANQEMIRQAFGHDENSTFVGWTPLFHDQGLIGNVLQPLYIGATCVLMAPSTFIRKPLLWLAAISRYRAHTSGGPNFAFDACVTHAALAGVPDLDLSSWRVAYNGAEPLRADTLGRFAETFAPHGFSEKSLYPCYGLAEATLLVTGSVPGAGARTLEADIEALRHGRVVPATDPHAENLPSRVLVSSGRTLPNEDVCIVDPETGRLCAPDRVGEVWVSGDQVAQGYWETPEVTAQTFQARCPDRPGYRYLRTGDLGIRVDGELYVVGRLKDLIIIRGRNHYPHDIEHTVQTAHPACAPAAAPPSPWRASIPEYRSPRPRSWSSSRKSTATISNRPTPWTSPPPSEPPSCANTTSPSATWSWPCPINSRRPAAASSCAPPPASATGPAWC
ncbi:fatty acyl-AMP ligase [Nocardia crassostreae]|uniref:fatty acyl-AMP ligase n=1 Tax=Nocardia crassostreae TaxID=53428 RepID=UPI000A651C8A|nr:fatty acyl-AMP ligase [Nocardia crassostreae]